MYLKNTCLLALLILIIMSCEKSVQKEIIIIPEPVSVLTNDSQFKIDASTTIQSDNLPLAESELNRIIEIHTGLELNKTSNASGKNRIILELKRLKTPHEEAYEIMVKKNEIQIGANTEKGLLLGLQTLRQLIPFNSELTTVSGVTIYDEPRFKWRGLHLDVSRHFFTVKDIKRQLDLMSMYKFNVFHWHLTDDQGWRVEIDKYPNLTNTGAWRDKVGFSKNQELGLNKDDGKPYGGFYSKDDIREVVQYAEERNITIVPEIEMPGHSQAALVSYPELYCFDNADLKVRTIGGVSDGVYCAGNENTFEFLEGILTEVMDLFPGKYIHIGGDEAPKRNWQACTKCQKRIQENHLNDEHELQSYFIKRIENFLIANNRVLIGWDEILEGGINKSTTIMSWRGTTPGLEAAQNGHKVVMTPGTPMYISRPQSVNYLTKALGPVASMREVYEFNPVPKELEAEFIPNIIGIQACHWTEGTPNAKVLEYKNYPRAIAVAEMAWTQKEKRNWNNFYDRYTKHRDILDFYEVGFGQRSYDVSIETSPSEDYNGLFLNFKTEVPGKIFYTLDGSEPDNGSIVFDDKIKILNSTNVKARMYKNDQTPGRIASQKLTFHKGIGKKVIYKIPYSSKHDGGGDNGLTNAILDKWQGFEKRNVDLILDLGVLRKISSIETNWYYDIKDWVLRPENVTLSISKDGEHFQEIKTVQFENKEGVYDKGKVLVKVSELPIVRYIQLRASNPMVLPHWHGSSGAATWIFLDEIIVN